MGAFYYDDPADRPYGPGNPDYEYDGRDDDSEAAQHDDLLRQQHEQESQK